uniref:Uncharacterized protein n=1 Tax=Anopheles darlingi TaxID=43151 RepID=A0A903WPH3_ANODA
MFPSFVPKSHHLVGHHTSGGSLKPYMTQFRAGTRLAPVAIRPAPSMIMSLKRPIKSILSHPSLMKQPLLKRPSPLAFSGTSASIKHHKFLSSPAGPSTGEIVFEKLKPVCVPRMQTFRTTLSKDVNGKPTQCSNVSIPPSHQITTKLTAHKDGAIHTIPAPNLGLTKSPKAPNQIRVTSYEDSNKLEIEVKTTKPTFTAKPPAYQLHPTVSDVPHIFGLSPRSVVLVDNHLSLLLVVGGPYKHHAINHQYQVTEEHSNDVTIGDPFSGKKTYFAPDPDPSLPSKTLIPTSDPLSTPSNGKYAPASDLLLQGHHQQQLHYPIQPQTSASAVIQYVNAVPQGSYAIPLATQPQLQQHILQQTAMLQEMPVSLYNPTYLVTQSNNLFNTHQQQGAVNLFKPDNHFLGAVQQQQQQQQQQVHQLHTQTPAPAVLFNSFGNYKNAEPAASTGQILTATQDQLHELQSVVSQIQLNDIHQLHHHHPHQQQQQLQEQSVDMPTYAQLVGHEQPAIHQQQLPQLNQLEQQLQQQLIQQHQQDSNGQTQRPMTDAEVAHLLNYGMINLHSNLAPSDYYHYQVDQPSVGSSTAPQQPALHAFYELSERQKENDQHQQAVSNILGLRDQPASGDNLQPAQQHYSYNRNQQQQQQQLQQAIGSTIAPQTTHSPLRIYVPEEADHEYSNSVHAQQRMDEIDFEYADAEGQIPTEDSKPTVAYEAIMDEDSEPAAEVPEDQEYQQQQSRTEEPDDEEENYTKNLSNHRLE